MLRRGVAVALPLLLSGGAWAGGKGTTAAGFLKAGDGARAEGMAEAYSALSADAGAVYWNPGALATLKKRCVMLMQSASLESTVYSYGAYAQNVGNKWGFGAAVQYQSAGTIESRDVDGFETGKFTPSDTAFSLGAARRVGAAAVGVVVKLVRSKIVDSASAVTGDLGVRFPGLLGGKASAALTATNVGGKIRYDRVTEDLPSAYRLGLGFRPGKRLLLGLDAVSSNDDGVYVAAGFETTVVRAKRFSLAFRGGYNTRSSGDAGAMSGAAFGLGFLSRGLGVDYAFLPMGDLGASHRVSLSYSF